jgi:hypothetical protein
LGAAFFEAFFFFFFLRKEVLDFAGLAGAAFAADLFVIGGGWLFAGAGLLGGAEIEGPRFFFSSMAACSLSRASDMDYC